jgi:O-antigen biosynthesis protein
MSISRLRTPSLRSLVSHHGRPPEQRGFRPTAVCVVDLEEPATDLPVTLESYESAWVLARLHGRPLGELQVTIPVGDGPGGLAKAVERALEEEWGRTVAQHAHCHASDPDELDGGEHALAGWESCLVPRRAHAPSVSVVVPTCRRPETVVRCVDSILATGHPDLEVIVVDNAPDDGRTEAALARRFPSPDGVRYLAEPVPGASRARNRGVAAAAGEFIAFVDDDVVVDRFWLAALIDALQRHPDVDCVTGLVVPDSLDTPAQLWFEQFGGFNRGYVRRLFDLSANRGDTLLYPYTAGALGGLGNSVFRSGALDPAGAFDTTLGPGTPAFGAEDQDAFVSLLRRGGQLLYEPSALVRHSHRDSYEELRWQIFTYGAGMVAGLVHWGTRDPAVAFRLVARVLGALPAVLRGGNRAAALHSATDACPAALRRLERWGHLYGPVAYARAVRRRRRIERALAAGTAPA